MAQHVATCCPPRDPQVIHPGHEADCPLCNPQTAASGEGPADASRPGDPGAVESGTPALTPGVLEDGGSVPVGESSPPAPDAPMADPPSPPLPEFYLTFGVQYAREEHPQGRWVHPDGYVVIAAPSYGDARAIVVDLFGQAWSDLYNAQDMDALWFPRGPLLRIEVPQP